MEITTRTNRKGRQTEYVFYGGKEWHRYPECTGQKNHSIRCYFRRAERQGGSRAGGKLRTYFLHKQVWVDHHGPIPTGMVVHHKDENPANNEIGNLELKTPSRHSKDHGSIYKAIAGPKDWHRTEIGRQCHSVNSKKGWRKRTATERVCQHCGKPYSSRAAKDALYCSDRCRAYARRDRGDDNEDRTCPQCGAIFSINRYSKTKCCSKKCGCLWSWSQRNRKTPARAKRLLPSND
jgi:hypothetical protein